MIAVAIAPPPAASDRQVIRKRLRCRRCRQTHIGWWTWEYRLSEDMDYTGRIDYTEKHAGNGLCLSCRTRAKA